MGRMGPRTDQDTGFEPAGGADHSQGPGPRSERPGRSAQRADHGAAFHLREREQLSLLKKAGWPTRGQPFFHWSRSAGLSPFFIPLLDHFERSLANRIDS